MSAHQKIQTILLKIQELALEAESLSKELTQTRNSPGYESTFAKLAEAYPLSAGGAGFSWKTCADVCREVGMSATRANCSIVGRCLSAMGVASKRSSGKSLVFLPDAIEEF